MGNNGITKGSRGILGLKGYRGDTPTWIDLLADTKIVRKKHDSSKLVAICKSEWCSTRMGGVEKPNTKRDVIDCPDCDCALFWIRRK